jgi:hypothetical protein
MANPEHVEIVKLGKEAIKDWREDHVDQTLDLSGADLREADLGEADLRKADLNGTDLSETDLRGTYLREADLREADLHEARLSGTDLRGTCLSGADLSGAKLSGARLSGANLSKANLLNVSLSASTDFSSSKFDEVVMSKRWAVILESSGLLRKLDIACMTIVDPVKKLRASYSGFQQWIHLSALVVFLLPYGTFAARCIVTAIQT